MFFVYVLCVLLAEFGFTEQTLIPGLVNAATVVAKAKVHGATDRVRAHEAVARAHTHQAIQRAHAHEALERSKIHAASAHLKGIRAVQPHPNLHPHHTAVLPHFAINYARNADPRTHHHRPVIHHHHHHHHGGHPPIEPHHQGFHGPSQVAIAQSIVNNIHARKAFHPHWRKKRSLENADLEKHDLIKPDKEMHDLEKLNLKELSLENNQETKDLQKRDIQKRNSKKRVLHTDESLEIDVNQHKLQKRDFQDDFEIRELQKRDLPVVAAARIAVDPLVKLNVIGTVDNLKDATKDLCENEDSPFFHVREAVGSARDAFFSLLKIAPNGLLVPTSYTIAEIEEIPQETVGAINKEALNNIDKGEPTGVNDALPVFNDEPEPKNTLSTIQMMMRNGFRSARDHATHVGDTIHSVRRAVLAVPRSTLKLLLPYLRSLELERERKYPKGLLGTSLKRPSPNEVTKIVGAGRILELLRKAASKDNSVEVVARSQQQQCPRRNIKQTYKQFLNRLREGIKDKLNNIQ